MKTISGKEMSSLLEKKGWTLVRVTGSHHIFTRPGSNLRITVPVHGNRGLKVGLAFHHEARRNLGRGILRPIGSPGTNPVGQAQLPVGVDSDAGKTRQTRLIPYSIGTAWGQRQSAVLRPCIPGRPEDRTRPRGHGSRPRPRPAFLQGQASPVDLNQPHHIGSVKGVPDRSGVDHGCDFPSPARALETKRLVRIASIPALSLTPGESGHLSQLSNKNPGQTEKIGYIKGLPINSATFLVTENITHICNFCWPEIRELSRTYLDIPDSCQSDPIPISLARATSIFN
jgi:predicted RNA binding protein YcfA (HicA-like mRNA interferase family)